MNRVTGFLRACSIANRVRPAHECSIRRAAGGLRRREPLAQTRGVERRMHFGVVVEITIDVAPAPARRLAGDAPRITRFAAALPGADTRSPSIERRLRIAARIDLL